MDTINYLIALTSDINLDKLLTTHKYIIAGMVGLLKLWALADPRVESNRITGLLKLFTKGNGNEIHSTTHAIDFDCTNPESGNSLHPADQCNRKWGWGYV